MDGEDEKKIFNKILESGLVLSEQYCSKDLCKKKGQLMKFDMRKRSKDAKNVLLAWRCTCCGTFKSVYDGSFFSMFKKSPKIILALFKCWSAQITIAKAMAIIQLNFEQKITRDTVFDIYCKLRQICSVDLDKENLKLGGNNKVIEIDESLYAKVKHNRGLKQI